MSDKNQNALALPDVTALRSMLEGAKDRLTTVAPKYLSVDKIIRLVLASASRNPQVLQCFRDSPGSVLLFAMKMCETGTQVIGAGGAWPVPFKNKQTDKLEMVFIPDYRGLINTARNAEVIKDAYAIVVRAGDKFKRTEGAEPSLVHEPNDESPGEKKGVYCIITLPDGTKRWEYMTRAEVEGIRDRSPAWFAGWLKYKKQCPWNTDEDAMWKKTVVRRAMNLFQGNAAELDEIIQTDLESEKVIDIAPQLTDGGLEAQEKELGKARDAAKERSATDPLPGSEKVGASEEDNLDMGTPAKVSEMNDGQKLVQMVKMFAIESGDSEGNILGNLTNEDDNAITSLEFAANHPEHKLVKLGLERAMGLNKKAKVKK